MKFKSKYPEYGFYVDGQFRQFHGGEYVANDEKEIEVLKALSDVEADEAEAPTEEVAAPKPKASRSSKK
ncbi:hypothetical protein AB1282_00290 [Gottfriedia sp. S16(2024)]|uniref:hypothetical protein n=1 Tax=Gottfriedia sp. S16(2024) TaxID=3162883 RepID=UPI003D231811